MEKEGTKKSRVALWNMPCPDRSFADQHLETLRQRNKNAGDKGAAPPTY